jgi:type IV pilus assembly protein PilV
VLSVPTRKPHGQGLGQAGFSMIEVMAAVVVLSFGLLVLAGFQLRVLSESAGASNRSIVVQLAGDIADRIRANRIPGAVADSPYVTDWASARSTGPEPSCTGAGAHCSATQLADYDLWSWKRAVAGALPGGLADIQSKAAAGGLLFVHIAWDEPAVANPIAPDPGWNCPERKACIELVVAAPQP